MLRGDEYAHFWPSAKNSGLPGILAPLTFPFLLEIDSMELLDLVSLSQRMEIKKLALKVNSCLKDFFIIEVCLSTFVSNIF